MHPVTLLHTRLSRRLALLAGALLLRPHAVSAEHDGTWHYPDTGSGGSPEYAHFPSGAIGIFDVPWPTPAPPPVSLDLDLTIDPDGSATVQGEILVHGDSPRRLLARPPVDADCGCADANGDRRVGLVRMAADFLEEASGAPVRVILTPPPGQDMDKPGIYEEVAVQVGAERVTLALQFTRNRGRRQRRQRGRR